MIRTKENMFFNKILVSENALYQTVEQGVKERTCTAPLYQPQTHQQPDLQEWKESSTKAPERRT